MSQTPQKLQQIIHLNKEIARIQDIALLLEKVLSTGRALANAEAGCLYLQRDQQLHCACTQNDRLQQQLGLGHDLTTQPHSVPVNHI
jgi:hypothetical protein